MVKTELNALTGWNGGRPSRVARGATWNSSHNLWRIRLRHDDRTRSERLDAFRGQRAAANGELGRSQEQLERRENAFARRRRRDRERLEASDGLIWIPRAAVVHPSAGRALAHYPSGWFRLPGEGPISAIDAPRTNTARRSAACHPVAVAPLREVSVLCAARLLRAGHPPGPRGGALRNAQ